MFSSTTNPDLLVEKAQMGDGATAAVAAASVNEKKTDGDGAEDEPVFESTTPSAMNLDPIKTDSTTQIDTQANRRGSATQTNNLVPVIKTEHVTTLEEDIDESEAEIDELNSIKREINNLTEATHLSRSRNPSVVESEEQLAHTQSVLDQLAESENLIHELSEPWEEKLKRSEQMRYQRMAILKEMGVALRDDTTVSGTSRFIHFLGHRHTHTHFVLIDTYTD